jgi:hypothetical protein
MILSLIAAASACCNLGGDEIAEGCSCCSAFPSGIEEPGCATEEVTIASQFDPGIQLRELPEPEESCPEFNDGTGSRIILAFN